MIKPATDPPRMNDPQVLFEELIEEITHDANNADRNLQRTIGPSGIGVECQRWLTHMIAETIEPETSEVKWPAYVGTAMHEKLERVMRKSVCQFGADGPRYLIEETVTVGTIGGTSIIGHVDLFDIFAGAVIDWKTLSAGQMEKVGRMVRLHGTPGQQKRIQAHTYGLGLLYRGHKVSTVMNVFLPRDGKLADAFYWAEPFDPQVGLRALDNCNEIAASIADPAVGLYGTLAKYTAPCTDYFCPWCPKTTRRRFAPGEVPDSKTLLGITKA